MTPPSADPEVEALAAQVAALEARVRELEVERHRVFADAQHEADAVFAQYQLSQLLAAGGTVAEISTAVIAEVARAVGAAEAALWLAQPGAAAVDLVATFPVEVSGAVPAERAVPAAFSDVRAARAWAAAASWSGTALPEGRSVGAASPAGAAGGIGFLAVHAEGSLDPGHVRYLASVRQELAVTLRAAQLRGWLAREQATLAAILEGATDAIVAVDGNRRIVRLNPAAEALVGAPPRAAGGMPCEAFLGCATSGRGRSPRGGPGGRGGGPPWPSGVAAPDAPAGDDAPGALLCGDSCPFGEVLESGLPIVGREIEVRHRDGGRIPVAASFSRMPATDGGAVGVLRDLRPARSLEAAKASFVAAVSHELRTPLALIDGYTQSLLQLDLDPTTARRHLERIAAAARRLAGLVDEIIDVGQLESDALVLRRTPVALDGVLRAYLAERADRPDARPIALDLPSSLPRVDVDGSRIRQVVQNLVENAEKHAGRASRRIEMRARRLDETTVVLTVADDGKGIPPEDRDHVFERFFRGRGARESGVPGSGLGLYLCRRIVEAHGGWIRLDATTRGTSISAGLPIAAGARAAAGPEGKP